MAHGFGAVRALRLPAYAERFAAEGYTVVTFDYRGFGDSHGTPRQVLDVSMQHADWTAALAFARTLDGVDPSKVVAWGTSFAGGHVISLAGRGEPLAAIIAQVPHVSGPAAVRSTGLLPSLRVSRPGRPRPDQSLDRTDADLRRRDRRTRGHGRDDLPRRRPRHGQAHR